MEIKKLCVLPALLLSFLSVNAMEDVKVTKFLHAGPYKINKPIISDSLDVNGK
ncbi:secreted protein, partial [gut metagenome]